MFGQTGPSIYRELQKTVSVKSTMSNRKVSVVAAATFLVLSGGPGKRRRHWVSPSLLRRTTLYSTHDLQADLLLDDKYVP